jgi:hypothetical protein
MYRITLTYKFAPKLVSLISYVFIIFLFLTGLLLCAINIYGLFQEIRPVVFFADELRFKHDEPPSFQESLLLLKKKGNESDREYSQRATKVISQSLAHIHWTRFPANQFNQLVPVWENYFLYLMGQFSDIPEFERYHFSDYKRSLKRGIGICGDASMILSQVLNNESISNNIISFEGHVVTAVTLGDGSTHVYDPDYGVSLPYSISEIQRNPSIIIPHYSAAGYSAHEISFLHEIYMDPYFSWDGVEHFITKKYWFEKITYALKWPLPVLMLFGACIAFSRQKKRSLYFFA